MDQWMQVQTMEQYVVFPGASGLRLGPQGWHFNTPVCVCVCVCFQNISCGGMERKGQKGGGERGNSRDTGLSLGAGGTREGETQRADIPRLEFAALSLAGPPGADGLLKMDLPHKVKPFFERTFIQYASSTYIRDLFPADLTELTVRFRVIAGVGEGVGDKCPREREQLYSALAHWCHRELWAQQAWRV